LYAPHQIADAIAAILEAQARNFMECWRRVRFGRRYSFGFHSATR